MFVFDWLFGHRKKESFWERSQREKQRFDRHTSLDEYGGGYSHYHHNDYAQQDFDDDLDSGAFDDL